MRRWLLALAASSLLVGCGDNSPAPAASKPLVLPTLASRLDSIDEVRLRGAGNQVLVTLHKRGGIWTVAERGDWPAMPGLVDTALFALSRAHLADGKTDQPRLYPRLGVEDVAAETAQGTEVRLSGGGAPLGLIIGKEHPKLDGNYVRVDGQARAWLTDIALSFEREPVGWIDRGLIDLPMARIAEVSVKPNPGRAFALSRHGDRFWPNDAPEPAANASHQGDAIAGALDQLQFDDVAVDSGSPAIDRTVRFTAVDGRVVELDLWREQGKVWARLSASLDAKRAAEWRAQAANAGANATVEKEMADWQKRFAGHAFLLPAYPAAMLYTGRDQVLVGGQ